ncbi:toxin TcdB middle/N-terminal domain-containing protein [Luteimonas saliphila]|uniref:toxin TcdB middle/N-terminal domain-containing protein n=1 Tax=Luteimonas saliphila TaxID=2804919 RepID=UPI00192D723F|nr:toxin TcdB middle/N-terminal domain-containing protein [Luteimonas saliphila]
MVKTALSRTSVRDAALVLLIIGSLLAPLDFFLRDLHAQDGEKNVPVTAPDVESDKVSAIAAEFRVDESGAATYSIPIYTVPGTAGVAPKLSLNYSSQGGYGPLGKGWSIGGLSSITRCRATREAGDFISGGAPTDGNPQPINFSTSDKYCLDGQRLIPAQTLSCTPPAGWSAQELHTEVQSFQRVCLYQQSGANGPAFFTVDRKDGSTSWYGDRDNNTTANRPDGYVETNAAGHTSKAFVWAQTRLQDSTGNYIDYLYHENPGTPAASVEHLLKEVRFTGKTVLAGQTGTALAPYAKVLFNYAWRPEAKRAVGYASGATFVQRWQLANIQSCTTAADGQCTTASQARFYELGYGTSASGSNLDVLTSVLECKDGSKAVCASPTTFQWSNGGYDFSTNESAANPANLTTDNFRSFKLGDINGDGRLDMALLYQAGSGCVNGSWVVTMVSSFNATGTPAYPDTQYNCVPAKVYDRGDGTWHLLDYDGDGRDDLFVSSATGQGWKVHPSTGTGFNMSLNLIAALPAIPSVDNAGLQVQIADLNGDGLTDIVYPGAGANATMRARLMERQGGSFGWGAERTFSVNVTSILQQYGCLPTFPPGPDPYTPQCDWWVSSMPTTKTGFTQLADFNGDAASDLLLSITVRTRTWTGLPGCMIEPLSIQDRGLNGADQAETLRYGPSASAVEMRSPAVKAPIECYEVTHYDHLHAMVPGQTTASTIPLASYSLITTGNPHAITLADANGDGLTDVFIRTNSSADWNYRLNRGDGFLSWNPLPLVSYRDQARFVDVNGDGRADMLQLANMGAYKAYQVRYALPSGGYAPVVALPGGNARLCNTSGCNENLRVPVFADLDGDGNLDFQSFNVASSSLGLTVARSNTRFKPRDVITQVTNGFGAITNIYYAPLTNNALYRRDSGSRNATNWGRGSPVSDLLMPMYAVSAVSSSSPQDGNPNAVATVHYRYAGAKMQAGGRGFLGFREIVTYDPNQVANQHVVTSTLYAQNFPFVGMPAETVKRVVNATFSVPACLGAAITNNCFSTPGQAFPALTGTIFSRSTQVWEADRDIGVNTVGFAPGVQAALHVRTAGSEEDVRDPASGAITSKVATTFGYGAYGNVLLTDVSTSDAANALLYTVTTSNTYAQDNAAKWRLGRLTHSIVTHSRPGVSSVVRKTAFNYAMGGAATGLLDVERTGYTESNGSGAADQNLLKIHTLDSYGNRTMTRICANANGLPSGTDCNAALTQFRPANARTIHRYSKTVFDSRGRFPTETWEPFWNGTGAVERKTSTVHARNMFGDVTHASDINGVQTRALYGTMGRPYYTWQQTTVGGLETDAASGVRSATRYRWCGTAAGEVTCPTGAKFRQETLTTDAPGQWTYLDVLGRPIMQATQTFNVGVSGKDVSAVCTTYDLTGKPRRVSNPFFLAGTAGSNGPTIAAGACTATSLLWTTTTYDVLGRPIAISTPDGVSADSYATATTAYNGLTTTVTDPRGKTTSSLNWATGELRRVTDANGTNISYAYQADGSVVRVDRDAGRGTVRNSFVYDSLGRKLQQTDPDAGVTTFEYNALGELTAQVDAAGNRIENWYDARGRVWRKVAKRADGLTESESLFNFDTATYGAGKPASESITGTYDGWIGQAGTSLAQSRTYTYDALGRPYGGTTTIDGVAYPAAVRYDVRGRVWKQQDASGRWALNQYNALGHLRAICDTTEAATTTGCPGSTVPTDPNARTAVIYLEADARGNIIRERRAQSADMDVVREYWPRSGRISGICAGNAATCGLMDEGYAWDAAGNLTTTQKETRYLEVYSYDNLSRLTLARATMVAGATANTTTFTGSYDAVGNICKVYGTPFTYEGRGGCGTGTLEGGGGTGTTGPHRVRQTTSASGVVSDYYYDIRGNQTLRDQSGTAGDRLIRYSLDNKAYEIVLGGTVRTRFWYGTDGQRYKRVHDGKTTLYLGNVEIETVGGVKTIKRKVAGVLQQSIVGTAVTTHYLFHDQLGSVVRTTTATGTIVDNLDYRHFGYRRSFTNPAGVTETGSSVTSRGFTGHEHVDGTNIGVIHMNGRIYDPQLHRFLQADPMIQAPGNLQSWNAYTYVFNNPLAYTDPTGMFSWRQVLGIVIAVVAVATQQYWAVSTAAKFWGTVAFGALAGGASTGTWQGALWGAVSAAAFFGIGEAFANAGNWATQGDQIWGSGLNAAGYAAKTVAHGVAGGVMSKLQGGKFGHGFASAGVTQAFSAGIDRIGGGASNYAAARVAAAAALGGTASVLSGGKFANGAVTAAFSRAFNEEVHQEHGKWPSDLKYEKDEPSYHRYTEVNEICGISENGCTLQNVGELMLDGYNAPSFGLRPQGVSAPGQDRLLYASAYAGMDLPGTYTLPGGVIRQIANRDVYMATNVTTWKHPLFPGEVNRMVIQSGGRVWAVTHGVGYNAYSSRLGASANLLAGPRMFRDQDRALQRAWRSKYGN